MKRSMWFQNERSQALILVIIILGVALALGTGLLFQTRSHQESVGLQTRKDSAYSLARSGVEIARSKMDESGGLTKQTYTFELGNATIEAAAGAITSIGRTDGAVQVLAKTVPVVSAPADPTPPPTTWAKTYGDTDDEYASAIQQTVNGGYIFGGNTTADDGHFVVVRTDGAGNVGVAGTWAKAYDSGTLDELNSLQQTDDVGYILGGTGDRDFLVIKTDVNGNIAGGGCGGAAKCWAKLYGYPATEVDELNSLQQTNDHGYILGGNTTAGSGDFLVIKIKDTGDLDTSFGTTGAMSYGDPAEVDELNSLQQTNDGGYILGGNTAAGDGDFLVIKTDANGNVKDGVGDCGDAAQCWAKSYDSGVGALEELNSLYQTNDGGYILGGSTTDGDGDFLVIKTDSTGDGGIWAKSYAFAGGMALDELNSLQQTDDGGYILGGNTTAWSGNFLVIKTDKGGNIIGGDCGDTAQCWARSYGGIYAEELRSLDQTYDDGNPSGYILGGFTESFGPIGSGRNFMAIKIDTSGDIIECIAGFTATPVDITVKTVTVTAADATATINPNSTTVTLADATVSILLGVGDTMCVISSVCPAP